MTKKTMILGAALAVLATSPLRAQDISGTWQGTVHAAPGQDLRIVLKISKKGEGGWRGEFFSIDQSPDPIPVSGVTLSGSTVKLSITAAHSSYQGTLGARDAAITGTWTQRKDFPLDFQRATAKTAWVIDPSPHKIQFVAVDKGVKLEVLDWGGTGRPLIFLAGLGANAHVFDKLALKFTATNHVFGITRRGHGASSKPDPKTGDYTADRLGDDVLAVIAALKLDRPVLAGHSLAGEELSSVGSRHPEKVSGLVYLDAGYSYAYYAPGSVIPLGVNMQLSAKDLQKDLDQLKTLPPEDQDLAPVMRDLRADLPQLETDLSAAEAALKAEPASSTASPQPQTQDDRINSAIINGTHKYTKVDVPILAFFEDPPFLPANTPPDVRAARNAQFATQANAFEAGLPSARVVRLANALHAIWLSNEADVVREMNAFMDGLPKR